jgi:hypothetical protein
MAYQHAVLASNWGGGEAKATGMLPRMAAILNRSRINVAGTDFNACQRFLEHVLQGYIAAACITKAAELSGQDIRNIQGLKSWLRTHDWSVLVDKVVRYYFNYQKVAVQRNGKSWISTDVHGF